MDPVGSCAWSIIVPVLLSCWSDSHRIDETPVAKVVVLTLSAVEVARWRRSTESLGGIRRRDTAGPGRARRCCWSPVSS